MIYDTLDQDRTLVKMAVLEGQVSAQLLYASEVEEMELDLAEIIMAEQLDRALVDGYIVFDANDTIN